MAKIPKRSLKDHISKSKRKLVKINDLQRLRKIRTNVAGIDVGAEYHYVAAPDPEHKGKVVVNRFGSFTTNLMECVDWLVQSKIESVAMEATGVYWMTLYTMLQGKGVEVVLVNARDFSKIKEKKTDVCDAEYLQLYHSYGLLEGAFIPEKKIDELRTYSRLRDQGVHESATSIQRMQKALIRMNLRLDNVLSDISGVTGMAIIKAILQGERNPSELAKLRDKRCKKSEEEIEESLRGYYRDDHLFALKQALEDYEYHLRKIAMCDNEIQKKLSEFQTVESKQPVEVEDTKPRKKWRKSKLKPHEFSFNLKDELTRITGVDLTTLPGIAESTALLILSETGLDMSRWKSEKHFASWLGLSPNNKISGGRILKNKSKQGNNRAAIAFRMSTSGLYNEANDTAIGAFFRRKRSQIGAPKAITAGGNKLARGWYRMLATGNQYVELGARAYHEMQKVKYLRRVKRTLNQWGLTISAKQKVPA